VLRVEVQCGSSISALRMPQPVTEEMAQVVSEPRLAEIGRARGRCERRGVAGSSAQTRSATSLDLASPPEAGTSMRTMPAHGSPARSLAAAGSNPHFVRMRKRLVRWQEPSECGNFAVLVSGQ